MDSKSRVCVYTDGSFNPQTQYGGWAWVTETGHNTGGIFNGGSSTAMELRAVLEALRNHKGALVIYSDCLDIVNRLNTNRTNLSAWLSGKRRHKMGALTRDLYNLVFDELEGREVEFRHVKAHKGNLLNTEADKFAYRSMRKVALGV